MTAENRLNDVPPILHEITLDGINRIDVGLEGDWSPTAVIIWHRGKEGLDLSKVTRSHPVFIPSLELYFEGVWLGIHCFKRIKEENVFDEALARQVVEYVESRLSR